MNIHHRGLFAMTLVTLLYGAPIQAAQPANANVQFVSPAELGMTNSRVTDNTTGVVRKRAAYGQGYVYGHSVNNQLGDIIIWDAAPGNSYGKSLSGQNRNNGQAQAETAIGPKLIYKPDYGKTTDPSYSQ